MYREFPICCVVYVPSGPLVYVKLPIRWLVYLVPSLKLVYSKSPIRCDVEPRPLPAEPRRYSPVTRGPILSRAPPGTLVR